jgi:V/A-type H+-transporting ATPase subunit I
MAVAEMKRVSVLLLRREHERLLKLLQRFGCVQLTQVDQSEAELQPGESRQAEHLEEDRNQLRWAIGKLSRYDKEKKSMFIPLPEVERAELEKEDRLLAMELVSHVEQLERQAGDLRGEETRLRLQQEQLSPWLELDIPFSQIKDTASCRVFIGMASGRGFAQLAEDWANHLVVLRQLGSSRDSVSFLAFSHISQAEEFHQALRGIGYQQVIPGTGNETARTQLERVNQELEALGVKMNQIDGEMETAALRLPMLRVAYEAFSAREARFDAHGKMAHTASSSLMSGWVPARAADALAERIKDDFPDAQVAISDPKEGEEPPVLLDNPALVSPYEAVISGFALPAPSAVDPTAVMMPFFACFFGMMVSDAGYGLVMAILIPILIKIIKPSEGERRFSGFWPAAVS